MNIWLGEVRSKSLCWGRPILQNIECSFCVETVVLSKMLSSDGESPMRLSRHHVTCFRNLIILKYINVWLQCPFGKTSFKEEDFIFKFMFGIDRKVLLFVEWDLYICIIIRNSDVQGMYRRMVMWDLEYYWRSKGICSLPLFFSHGLY